MNNIKYYIGIILKYLHLFIGFITTLYLLYTDNVYYIIFIIFATFILMSSWYFFNDCILFSLENYLMNKKNEYHDFTKFKEINVFGRHYYIFNHVLYSTYFYSTITVFLIALIKLIIVCNKKMNKKIKC